MFHWRELGQIYLLGAWCEREAVWCCCSRVPTQAFFFDLPQSLSSLCLVSLSFFPYLSRLMKVTENSRLCIFSMLYMTSQTNYIMLLLQQISTFKRQISIFKRQSSPRKLFWSLDEWDFFPRFLSHRPSSRCRPRPSTSTLKYIGSIKTNNFISYTQNNLALYTTERLCILHLKAL